MPRRPSGNFDQKEYVAEYHRTHLRNLSVKVQREEYDRFSRACEKAGMPMATVLRNYMITFCDNVLGDNPLLK